MKRVVITGTGAVCALGDTGDAALERLRAGDSAVQIMPAWEGIDGLNTALGAPATHFELPASYTRRQRRSMGRVAAMSVLSTQRALTDAGLADHEDLKNGTTGVAFGSSMGSEEAVMELAHLLINSSTSKLNATSYIRMMSHTSPVNIGVLFAMTGRVIPSCSACTSGSQGIGYAYESIRDGKQKVMVAGGADELSPGAAAIFGGAHSADEVSRSPRPYAQDAGGGVLGEGACALVLEDAEYAAARGATVLGEIVGFATNNYARSAAAPNHEELAKCMRLALADAELEASAIGYVAGLGLARSAADAAECAAMGDVFVDGVPMSATKSYLGHTLAASGALEAWLSLHMMNAGWFAPTRNLGDIAEACASVNHIVGDGHNAEVDYILCNTFAFGGINTSLVLRRS